jgi:hypothetical protein
MAEQKLRDMHQDHRGALTTTQAVLERIKTFCVQGQRKNAFLVEIVNDDPTFKAIQDLIALRLIHVLHEGITPHEAGRRYQALLLDYGFYVGVRAAKSVDLFHKEPKTPTVQELRKLPIFSVESTSRPKGKGTIVRKKRGTGTVQARQSAKRLRGRRNTKSA